MRGQRTSVKLISWTQKPVETLALLWEASRSDDPNFPTLDSIDPAKARETFRQMLDMEIPVTENVYFTFILDGVSISLREQLVRHRIGCRVGDRVGIDIIPDTVGSSWWAQSMRLLDMGTFATDEHYRVSPALAGKTVVLDNPDPNKKVREVPAVEIYQAAMKTAEDVYQMLLDAGVPAEEARDVIPLGATHRISWTLSLKAMQHILHKRSCWILQLGLWEPVVRGMARELREKVGDIFAELVKPPCMSGAGFTKCSFPTDNERRFTGVDKLPPCPLWHAQELGHSSSSLEMDEDWRPADRENCLAQLGDMRLRYGALWHRNLETGELLP